MANSPLAEPVQLAILNAKSFGKNIKEPRKDIIKYIGKPFPLGVAITDGKNRCVYVNMSEAIPAEYNRLTCFQCGAIFGKIFSSISNRDLNNKLMPQLLAHAAQRVYLQGDCDDENRLVTVTLMEADQTVKLREMPIARHNTLAIAAESHALNLKHQEDANAVLVLKLDNLTAISVEMSTKIDHLTKVADATPTNMSRKRTRGRREHPPIRIRILLTLICPKDETSTAGFSHGTGEYDPDKADNRLIPFGSTQ